jgi:RNA recognition motif-containing protein
MLFCLVSYVRNVHANHHQSRPNGYSISAQVIMRGNRSAGYGFVALSTVEAAQKAVEVLDKQLLDNRPIIVEIARPAEQKESERRDRKPRNRRPGRRGSRAVPGEVTEAEANGEAKAEEDIAPAEGEAPKPKKKKKKSTVSFI